MATAPTYGLRIVFQVNLIVLVKSPGRHHVLSATNIAYDYDPANKVTFSLAAAPSGATINSSTGVLKWQAPGAAISSSNYFTVSAVDNGSPAAIAAMSFAVVVNAPNSLNLTFVSLIAGTATMQITGGTGTTNVPPSLHQPHRLGIALHQ